MDPALIDAIKVVLLDAIKILGPAIVAALATYKATKAQMEIKLQELDRAHGFGAREHWFKYYKERQDHLATVNERLKNGLGQLLGTATGYVEGGAEADNQLVRTLAEAVLTLAKLTPSEIETTSADMEDHGLAQNADHQKLLAYVEPLRQIEQGTDFEALKRNLFLVLEVHHFLQRCNDAVLKQEMKRAFGGYVDN